MRCFLIAVALSIAAPVMAETQLGYPVSELYVVATEQAQLRDKVLTLTGPNSKVIWFTDRPERKSGAADTRVFIANWPKGEDSFEVDPPNAVLVGSDADGDEIEIAMELTEPKWDEGELSLRVLPLSQPLPKSLDLGDAHLFIDNSGPGDSVPEWCGHECFNPVSLD